jgi:hypothetical protein
MTFMRDSLASGSLPKHFAGLAIEAENHELMEFDRFLSAAKSTATASTTTATGNLSGLVRPGSRRAGRAQVLFAGRRVVRFRLDPFARGYCGQDENFVLPNDGRGRSLARDFDLPLDVLGLVPFGGRIGVGRDAALERTAPLRPVLLG